jgi:predicted  nucleic acid-binding Zn-ribbon protein
VNLAPLIPIVAIVAWAATKMARINASRPASASSELNARVEELERVVQGLQKELAETQERLDFAERLLTKGREERRVGR